MKYMEYLVLGLFSAALCVCVAAGWSVIYALLFGYLLFFTYGLLQKRSASELLLMSWKGVRTVRNILITFLLIGMITALWRASGTIAVIISYALHIVSPKAFILISFLLCCLVSALTGTSFGTAATVGVICMTMGNGMGLSPFWMGGAILSGSFFGDRCSPMSTSALLTSQLTGTDIYRNIKNMIRTSVGPFVITCMIYLTAGWISAAGTAVPAPGAAASGALSMEKMFADNFSLHPVMILPAALIILLSLFKLNVKITMSASILTAWLLAWYFQKAAPAELFLAMVQGYRSADPQLSSLLDGGGIVSMGKVFAIVCISSSFSGIFDGTGILDKPKKQLARLGTRISPYGTILVTSVLTCMISCNQTLGTMLTCQLCQDMYPDKEKLAVTLENTVIVIAPLIPWSIAGTVPLATVSAPITALLAACYLYLLPVWNYFPARHEASGIFHSN